MGYLFKTIYAFAIATAFFSINSPELFVFWTIFISAWAMLVLSYGRKCNIGLLCSFVAFSLGITTAYVTVRLIINQETMQNLTCGNELLLLACFLELVILGGLYYRIKESKACPKCDNQNLFAARKYDLDRIEHFVHNTPLLGINSIWGNGKSFVINHLCERDSIINNFEVIRIDLLTCNLDEIELTLLSEFERILTRNRIFPKNSRHIKKLIGDQSILKQVQNSFLSDNEGVSANFDGIKEDVKKLSKKILIIYEDIDRISNDTVIKKIFAISEKIAGEQIHIIYQYDQRNLEEIKLNRDYVEKYIPFMVSLTELDFEDIVNDLWHELNMEILGVKQKDFVNTVCQVPTNYQLQKELNYHHGFSVLFHDISIRKVRVFMEEVKFLLLGNEHFLEEKNRSVLIKVIFLKSFFYHHFDKFLFDKPLEQCLMFIVGEEECTLQEILRKKKDGNLTEDQLAAIFQKKENIESLAILMLLEYDVVIEERTAESGERDVACVDIAIKKEQNERINRILKNVLGNGKSEYTDAQAAIIKLEQDVFSADEETEIKKAWGKYRDNLFNGKYEKDNVTIFKMGEQAFISLFRALAVVEGNKDQWLNLFKLREIVENKNVITKAFIESLNYCVLNEKDVFLEAISTFSQYKIIGNLNKDREYGYFLSKYTCEIFRFGFSRNICFEPYQLEIFEYLPDQLESGIRQLKHMIAAMEEERKRIFINQAQTECDLIIRFLRKNLEIIQTESAVAKDNGFHFQSHVKTVWPNQEEFDKLNKLIKEGEFEEFCFKVEESYKLNRINPSDLRDLEFRYKKALNDKKEV